MSRGEEAPRKKHNGPVDKQRLGWIWKGSRECKIRGVMEVASPSGAARVACLETCRCANVRMYKLAVVLLPCCCAPVAPARGWVFCAVAIELKGSHASMCLASSTWQLL